MFEACIKKKKKKKGKSLGPQDISEKANKKSKEK